MMVQFNLVLVYLISLTSVNSAETNSEPFDVLSDPESDVTNPPISSRGSSFRRGQFRNARHSEPLSRTRLEGVRRPQRHSFANHARHYSFADSSTASSSQRDASDILPVPDRLLPLGESSPWRICHQSQGCATIQRRAEVNHGTHLIGL